MSRNGAPEDPPASIDTPTAPAPFVPDPRRPRFSSDTDDAVLALLHAGLGYQAATAAATRVKLPSLSDFVD